VRDRTDRFTPTYRRLGAFILKLKGKELDAAQIRAEWANPETEQPLQQAQVETARAQGIVVKREAGISRKQGLRELGYTDEQITKMDAEDAEDPLAKPGDDAGGMGGSSGMGKAMLDAFAQGR